MASLRIASSNLNFLKRWLRLHYREIRSGHRTEALAAACGYQKCASLLAELHDARAAPQIAIMNGGRWSERLAELGYPGVQNDLMLALICPQQLPDPCWIALRGRENSAAATWFYRCKAEDLPYITIKFTPKYATLEWDCITLDATNDGPIRHDMSGGIVKELFANFQQLSSPAKAKPYFCGTAFTGSIDGLDPEVAHQLADQFFGALYKASHARATTIT